MRITMGDSPLGLAERRVNGVPMLTIGADCDSLCSDISFRNLFLV